MKLAIAMLIAGTTAVSAAPAPYYVGTNLSQPNHLAL